MCRAPIFVTSSSFRALRYATQLLGVDARFATDPAVGYHGGKTGFTPLLEMAVLSASRVIVGSAGSTYPLEAANFGGTTAIVRDFGLYDSVSLGQRQQAIQGDCFNPSPPGASLLLPDGACS